tara:strand:- start:1353 stop:1937 length:585 start_codon:yes stop_codon:yes gene_type:complete
VLGLDCKRKSEKGMTLLEALVSTVIIGIGFVAVFQMVNYSVQSIDVSGERTKASYLAGMVAEDIISEKHSTSPTTDKKLMDYLIDNKSQGKSWAQATCSQGASSSANHSNTWANKKQKWENRFSKRRIKCRNNEEKFLKVYDICRSGCNHTVPTIYDKWYIGKMEVNLPTSGTEIKNGKRINKVKKKYLYFQIH